MELEVLNINGQSTGKKIELPENVFGLEPNDHVIYLAVKQYLANQRQGTHKSKEKSEIVGSTKKLKKQKGTGTARAGSIKSPVFRGGGRIFGPKPRNYSSQLNKKVKSLARNSALAYKAKDNKIKVIEDISFDQPKTKEYKSLLGNLQLEGKKSLLVLNEDNKNVYLSSRNIQKAEVKVVNDLNTYAILNADELILSESTLSYIKERF